MQKSFFNGHFYLGQNVTLRSNFAKNTPINFDSHYNSRSTVLFSQLLMKNILFGSEIHTDFNQKRIPMGDTVELPLINIGTASLGHVWNSKDFLVW